MPGARHAAPEETGREPIIANTGSRVAVKSTNPLDETLTKI